MIWFIQFKWTQYTGALALVRNVLYWYCVSTTWIMHRSQVTAWAVFKKWFRIQGSLVPKHLPFYLLSVISQSIHNHNSDFISYGSVLPAFRLYINTITYYLIPCAMCFNGLFIFNGLYNFIVVMSSCFLSLLNFWKASELFPVFGCSK